MAATNKTTENNNNVNDFIAQLTDDARCTDSRLLVQLLQQQTGFAPRMWGTAIIGFGSYHYRYESGREGDAPLIGFSPRSNALTLYLDMSFEGCPELLKQLGKHKTSKACLYIKKLADVDLEILKQLVDESVKEMKSKYA